MNNKRMFAAGRIAPRADVERVPLRVRVRWWLRDLIAGLRARRSRPCRHYWMLANLCEVGTGCENYVEHHIATHECDRCGAVHYTRVHTIGEQWHVLSVPAHDAQVVRYPLSPTETK